MSYRDRPLYAYHLTRAQWTEVEQRVESALAVYVTAANAANAVRERIAHVPVPLRPYPDPTAPIKERDLPGFADRPKGRAEFVAWLKNMTPAERRTWYVDALLDSELSS